MHSRIVGEMEQTEIQMPDEERVFPLLWANSNCHLCGCAAELMRRTIAPMSFIMTEFAVKCVNKSCNNHEPSDWRKSSQEAIQIWKMQNVLCK